MKSLDQLANATETVTTANYRSPKTVLGFFAIVVAIVVTGATFVTGLLSRTPTLHHLVVPVLLFAGILVVAVLVGIFVTAWKDPTTLMLGQVTGEVFIENRRLTLGDSNAGEYTEDIVSAIPRAVPVLPPGEGERSEDNQ